MAGYSGKWGNASAAGATLFEIIGWEAEPKNNVSRYGSNLSGGWKTGVAGVNEVSGKIEVKLQGGQATLPVNVGQTVALILGSGPGIVMTFTAIVESTPVKINIDNGEAVSATYNFVGISSVTYSLGSSSGY